MTSLLTMINRRFSSAQLLLLKFYRTQTYALVEGQGE